MTIETHSSVQLQPEPSSPYTLTESQKDHFLQHGYVVIPNCFTREKALSWTENVWTRLGYSATDKSLTSERINMPHHREEAVRTFAPRAWAAICELCGGEDRISEEFGNWRDSLIVNLGLPEYEGMESPDPRELDNWHVDGDFFWHYLDSPEQALLVIPLFSDIAPRGGGTMICPEAIPLMARYLYEHPEGVSPIMVPRGEAQEAQSQNPDAEPSLSFFKSLIQKCTDFHEMTGQIGDVILMHPLMMHSASRNILRTPRIITNPPVALKEPFNFNREDPNEYSLIERKTLLALGRDRLEGWKITTERERIVPARLKKFHEMKVKEEERLRQAAVSV